MRGRAARRAAKKGSAKGSKKGAGSPSVAPTTSHSAPQGGDAGKGSTEGSKKGDGSLWDKYKPITGGDHIPQDPAKVYNPSINRKVPDSDARSKN